MCARVHSMPPARSARSAAASRAQTPPRSAAAPRSAGSRSWAAWGRATTTAKWVEAPCWFGSTMSVLVSIKYHVGSGSRCCAVGVPLADLLSGPGQTASLKGFVGPPLPLRRCQRSAGQQWHGSAHLTRLSRRAPGPALERAPGPALERAPAPALATRPPPPRPRRRQVQVVEQIYDPAAAQAMGITGVGQVC